MDPSFPTTSLLSIAFKNIKQHLDTAPSTPMAFTDENKIICMGKSFKNKY